MGKGIVALVWGEDDRSYDIPIKDSLLSGIKGERLEIPFVDRAFSWHSSLWDILNPLVDDYEIREMTLDHVISGHHTIDYGFFRAGSWADNDWLSERTLAYGACGKTFLWHDIYGFFLIPKALAYLKEHKEKITGLIVNNPNLVSVVERVTGIKALLKVANSSGVESVFGQEKLEPTKSLLVVGGVNERGGLVANAFAEFHFYGDYDVIQRHPIDAGGYPPESVELLAGCSNFYPHMGNNLWHDFILDYKYLVDGTSLGCFTGRVGWDAFSSGRSFIGVKNRSYTAYLFDAISIDSEIALDGWQDIGWQKAHQLAKERLVTKEEILAIWSEVL